MIEKMFSIISCVLLLLAVAVAVPISTHEPSTGTYSDYDYYDDEEEKDPALVKKCQKYKNQRAGPDCYFDEELIDGCCVLCSTCPAGSGKPPGTDLPQELCTEKCVRCIPRNTYKEYESTLPCDTCMDCGHSLNRLETRPCTVYENARCGECKPGYYSEFPEDLMTYCSKCRPGIKGCPDSVDSIRTTTYSTISRKRNRTLLSHPVNEFLTSVVPSFSKKVTTTPPNNVKPWVAPSANRIENATVTSNADFIRRRITHAERQSKPSKHQRSKISTKNPVKFFTGYVENNDSTDKLVSTEEEKPVWIKYVLGVALAAFAVLSLVVVLVIAKRGLLYEIISGCLKDKYVCWIKTQANHHRKCVEKSTSMVSLELKTFKLEYTESNEEPLTAGLEGMSENVKLLKSEDSTEDSQNDQGHLSVSKGPIRDLTYSEAKMDMLRSTLSETDPKSIDAATTCPLRPVQETQDGNFNSNGGETMEDEKCMQDETKVKQIWKEPECQEESKDKNFNSNRRETEVDDNCMQDETKVKQIWKEPECQEESKETAASSLVDNKRSEKTQASNGNIILNIKINNVVSPTISMQESSRTQKVSFEVEEELP